MFITLFNDSQYIIYILTVTILHGFIDNTYIKANVILNYLTFFINKINNYFGIFTLKNLEGNIFNKCRRNFILI